MDNFLYFSIKAYVVGTPDEYPQRRLLWRTDKVYPLMVICETSQVLLAGGQVFFLGDLQFSPHLMIDSK